MADNKPDIGKASSIAKKKKSGGSAKKAAQKESSRKKRSVSPKKKLNEPVDEKRVKKGRAVSPKGKDLSQKKVKAIRPKTKTIANSEVSKSPAPATKAKTGRQVNSLDGQLGDNKDASTPVPSAAITTAEISKGVSSNQSKEHAEQIKPNDEEILFLNSQHKSVIEDIISCLKSEAPFCFLSSEIRSYIEYYKEIVIDHFKNRKEIKLLYFDPKFGDDLSVVINKELESIDISLIGVSKVTESRKILVIDNEDFASHLDWELIDSLRVELKAANIGVFSINPTFLDDNVKTKTASIVSSFKCFDFPKIKKNELKKLNEYISGRPDEAKLTEILSNILVGVSAKDPNNEDSSETDKRGIFQRARKFILRK